jgi:short-subunit dehydrogenase
MDYKLVLITGAANGIGKQLAICLSKPGVQLVLVDNDNSGPLIQTAGLCRALGADVKPVLADVRDQESLNKSLINVIDLDLQFDLVFAFAGVGVQNVDGMANSAREIIDTNFFGVVNIFNFFSLPKSPPSNVPTAKKLISVSSIGGLVATHNSGFYSASKAALMKYTDSLRLLNSDTGVEVHDIVLGFVQTRMIKGLKHAEKLAISDARAANLILTAISKGGKRVHSIPRIRNLPWSFLSYLPSRLRSYLLNRLFGAIYRT